MRDGGRSLKEEALERDYPKLRRSTVCAYCTGPKEVGLVVCWRCNREEKQFTAKTGRTVIGRRSFTPCSTEPRFKTSLPLNRGEDRVVSLASRFCKTGWQLPCREGNLRRSPPRRSPGSFPGNRLRLRQRKAAGPGAVTTAKLKTKDVRLCTTWSRPRSTP
jgi:hypothetical protein